MCPVGHFPNCEHWCAMEAVKQNGNGVGLTWYKCLLKHRRPLSSQGTLSGSHDPQRSIASSQDRNGRGPAATSFGFGPRQLYGHTHLQSLPCIRLSHCEISESGLLLKFMVWLRCLLLLAQEGGRCVLILVVWPLSQAWPAKRTLASKSKR